ncbi:hypothetical protein [Nostoc sp.]|uniref:hypothetical protein n=1 Tax=Nostoc sp. TaxID=1180 RepID=UPI002FF5DCFC
MTDITKECFYCDGSGITDMGYRCPECAGTGDAEHFTKVGIGISLLFGPGLLGILGQYTLHSVPSAILTPILIPSTIGVATYVAWFFGKKLKEELRNADVWLLPIKSVIFLFVCSFIYILFYRYDLYNSICSLIIPIYALLAIVGAILFTILKKEDVKEETSTSLPSSNPSLKTAPQSLKIAVAQSKKHPSKHLKSISFLLYAGIIMALAVQFARANAWSLPIFKSYEDAFATSFFLVALGIAHTAHTWKNNYVALGLFLTTIGGFAWKYKWILPVFKTYEIPLSVGIFLILYGSVPQFVGGTLVIVGSLLLSVELWLMFTKGLGAIHAGNLLASLIFLGLSVLMFRRQKKLQKTGIFRK